MFRQRGQWFCLHLAEPIGRDLAEHSESVGIQRWPITLILKKFWSYLSRTAGSCREFMNRIGFLSGKESFPGLSRYMTRNVDVEYVKKFKEFLEDRGEI